MTKELTEKNIKERLDLNETIIEWKTLSHPYKKRDRIFYQTVIAIAFLLIVIVTLMHEFILIGVILSIVFVVYAISSVPPVEVEHKITPLGFYNAGEFYSWIDLYAFWFEKKWDYKTLVIQTRLSFPGQVRAVVDSAVESKIKEIVGKYLLYMEKPPKSWTENISHFISRIIPLETSK